MATAKKLKSGNWRTLVYSHTDSDKKKHYESFTADTKKESEYMAAEFALDKVRKTKPANMTVGDAIDKYIDSKDGILSPATIAGYRKIKRSNLQGLMSISLANVSRELIQSEVNREAKLISPKTKRPLSAKTIANAHGLLYSALELYAPDVVIKTTLPRSQKNITELPSPKAVYDLVKGTEIELPCLLAMWLSYSMSEIRGIKISSISDDGYIIIKEVIVDVDGKPTPKDKTKALARTRRSKVSSYLFELIKSQETYKRHKEDGTDGYLITMTGKGIYDRFILLQKKSGFPHTRFHDLRALNASVMLQLNIPDKYAQERGGWLTDHTLKSVYQKTFSDERIRVDQKIDEHFERVLFGEIQHEIQHEKI